MASLGHILFICGSLEPGRDGVGDYTRMLAAQLSRLDYSSKIVALYDKEVREVTAEQQVADGIDVATLRIPKEVNDKKRFTVLKTEIASAKPSWVSLQFVPYSFNKRGLPYKLAGQLRKTRSDARLHIMFHELWIGEQNRLHFKSWLINLAQKYIIRNLVQELAPDKITTQLPLFRDWLQPLRVNVLPLFGNITVVPVTKQEGEAQKLQAVSFGGSPSPLEFKDLSEAARRIASSRNQELELTFLGRGGKHKDEALSLAREVFGASNVKDLTLLNDHDLSVEMQKADFGIAKTNGEILGKSGSAVAMLEHGLPVLVSGYKPKDSSVAPYFADRILYGKDMQVNSKLNRVEAKASALLIAEQFLVILGNEKSEVELNSSR